MSPSPKFLFSAEDVLAALDQRRITGRLRSWVIDILGVHTDGADLWVQIGRKRHAHESLVLHVVRGVTVEEVLQLLADHPPMRYLQRVLTVSPATGCSTSVH